MDTIEEERSITVKSSGFSLPFDMKDERLNHFIWGSTRQRNEYLINLIDTPGHVDFSADVTASLRITDGAFLVVDCVEGICTRPVLLINKLDKYFLDLQLGGEEAYGRLKTMIDHFNHIVETYPDASVRKWKVSPSKGTVVFAAGIHEWSFKLKNFSKSMAAKFAVTEKVIVKKLWGSHFFDTRSREWSIEPNGSRTCNRGFVAFFYQPIMHIIKASVADQKEELWRLFGKYDLNLYLLRQVEATDG